MNRININDGNVLCPMEGNASIDSAVCRECAHCVHCTSGWIGCSFQETHIDFTVDKFSKVMREKLKWNDLKGGWHNCNMLYLMLRLVQECGELSSCIQRYEEAIIDENRVLLSVEPVKILSECADVANFAMMIADSIGSLSNNHEVDG